MDRRVVGAPERRGRGREVRRAVQLFDVALLGFVCVSGVVLALVKVSHWIAG